MSPWKIISGTAAFWYFWYCEFNMHLNRTLVNLLLGQTSYMSLVQLQSKD